MLPFPSTTALRNLLLCDLICYLWSCCSLVLSSSSGEPTVFLLEVRSDIVEKAGGGQASLMEGVQVVVSCITDKP